jgi:ribosomal protein S17E
LPDVPALQGRVRTKTVKRASRILIEKYYQKLTMDFDTNKRICDEVADIQTKRLRNKIAGFTTVSHQLSLSCRRRQHWLPCKRQPRSEYPEAAYAQEARARQSNTGRTRLPTACCKL